MMMLCSQWTIQVIWWRHFLSEITNQRRAENSHLFPHPARLVSTLVDSRAIRAKDQFVVIFVKENPQFRHKSIR